MDREVLNRRKGGNTMAEENKDINIMDQKPGETPPGTTPPDTKPKEPDAKLKEISVEDQMEEMRKENIRLKRASDKNSGEAADYKRKLSARMTEDELAKEEKAEMTAFFL